MKIKVALSVLASLMFSASALAATPASYDTKFNVSANVPDSVRITDPSGRPVTDLDVVMKAVASGYMEAQTPPLKIWNNDMTKLEVSMTLDDSQAASGSAFTLYSTQGSTLNHMSYKITTLTSDGLKTFATSGESNKYTLVATTGATHSELPVVFRFVSDSKYDSLAQGNYTGVVYANVSTKP
ncbi:hypothetical protein [Serratia marcescens]|uniref:hypothetical protein n=1 Tax=Serratia marcescens TaxID=615 RepID=UPI0002B88FE3|nr:hypothetical protein [Serratia marcescens]EMF04254.1 hypothetical protein F518_18478 [Serratia marcescens VGH107]